MTGLTFALPKGRIMEEALEMLEKAGFSLPGHPEDSRRLIFADRNTQTRYILAKPMDVAAYVEHGAADLGIAGKDVLIEEKRDVYEWLDLNLGRCRLSVAGLPGHSGRVQKVATKYPSAAADFFRRQGAQVEIIKLNGSIELAPIVGLADRIVDIVQSGETLKENGLAEYEKIADITSRLIVNPASYRMKKTMMDEAIKNIQQARDQK